MALSFSTALRNYVGQWGSYIRALKNGRMVIYQGTVPTGTIPCESSIGSAIALVTISASSGTWSAETRAAGSVELTTGGSGSVNTITASGVDILGGAVSYNTSLIVTAATIASQINLYNPLGIYAVSDGDATPKITLYAPYGVGAVTWTVSSTATTITKSDVNFGSEVAGVAPASGLQWSAMSAGLMSKSGTWSGTVNTSGSASFYRIYGSLTDSGLADTAQQYFRIQGTCGTSGADYTMALTSLISGYTHTVDNFAITLPAS